MPPSETGADDGIPPLFLCLRAHLLLLSFFRFTRSGSALVWQLWQRGPLYIWLPGAFLDNIVGVFTAVVVYPFQPFDCAIHTAPINQLAVLVARIVF